MSLASLTRESVLAATAEFDNRGRAGFLAEYGFSKAKSYFLELDEHLYDSKAIVGRALGLSPANFSGGDRTVARRLEELNFSVRYFPAVPWKREEIILACAVVEANGWRQPNNPADWRIIELSELLQTSAFHPLDQHGPDFRNPAGVGRKMADIATSHPDYTGKQTRGNHLDGKVVHEFLANPGQLHAEAARLRTLLLGGEPIAVPAVKAPADSGQPIVDVPVEAHLTASFHIRSRSADSTAHRRESKLVMRYREWREASGHRVIGRLILLPGDAGRLRIDLYDVHRSELIEAKGSTLRDYVRFALGQILDYARYVDHEHLAVLLPAHPGEDLVDLLRRHAVDCIYQTPDGAFERVNHH